MKSKALPSANPNPPVDAILLPPLPLAPSRSPFPLALLYRRSLLPIVLLYRRYSPEEADLTEAMATPKPDLIRSPTASLARDDEVVVLETEAEALTDAIETSMVNLTVDDVIEMPFVKPNGGYLVGSLLQKRRFSASAMEKLMLDKLWNPLYEVQMQEIERNLFLFGFEHQMDLKKVVREGPWRFNKHFLILQEIESPSQAVREQLKRIPIWVHIIDVPPTWLTLKAAEAIAIKIGTVLEIDPDSVGMRGLGYLRVRVALLAAAPLPRGLTIEMGEASKVVEFRYERLENYCYRCGYMDHIEDDCPKAYDPREANKAGWRKEYAAFPPIKRISRQLSSRPARTFGSVSPIEGAGWSPRNQSLVIDAKNLGNDRARKRPCWTAPSIPPGFEEVNSSNALVPYQEGSKSEEVAAKTEDKVGNGAHLKE